MNLAHKTRLYPNNEQATYFAKASGCARLAYNWGLKEWQVQYEAGGKPSALSLKKEFNAIKGEFYPFVYEVTKTACEGAFRNLGKAFKNFFTNVKEGKDPGYPRFKKKGIRDSFYIDNSKTKVGDSKVWIPKAGWVRMAESLRFPGRIMSVTVSKTAGVWFASISVEIPDGEECSENQVHSPIGIDLGVSNLAALSNGGIFENPKTTKKYAKKLRRLNKSLARKKKYSNNFKKVKLKLARLHHKIQCVRTDAIHKMTTFVTQNFSDVCMEDLNTKGMLKNRNVSKDISDAAFGEIRRQLEYKAIRVHFVDRFFPSSKLCMECGTLHDMPLHKRVFCCECNSVSLDRDIHAAQNIVRQALSELGRSDLFLKACGEGSSGQIL